MGKIEDNRELHMLSRNKEAAISAWYCDDEHLGSTQKYISELKVGDNADIIDSEYNYYPMIVVNIFKNNRFNTKEYLCMSTNVKQITNDCFHLFDRDGFHLNGDDGLDICLCGAADTGEVDINDYKTHMEIIKD